MNRPPSFRLEPVDLATVRDLCERHHAYAGCSRSATYAFGVVEGDRVVAVYAWQPPVGAARSVNPYAPQGVLALSRMVAVPREQRALNHVSRPLRHQMRHLIDRTRWPSLVTYSDEGLGHTGHVYRCSGWTPTRRSVRPQYVKDGRRTSAYSDGRHDRGGLTLVGRAWVQRWEHHAVPVEESPALMAVAGWERVPVPGKVWKSGSAAMTFQRRIA